MDTCRLAYGHFYILLNEVCNMILTIESRSLLLYVDYYKNTFDFMFVRCNHDCNVDIWYIANIVFKVYILYHLVYFPINI